MNTAQTTKNLAQKIAKQMLEEPLEILKTAKSQVTGVETKPNTEARNENLESRIENENYKLKQELQSQRIVGALNQELRDISRENTFKELQRKISEGIDVYLEEYPELSIEQKQVLKAQIEAVKNQLANNDQQSNLPEPSAKKGRKLFNFGKKTSMKREQTRVEKVVPPSG